MSLDQLDAVLNPPKRLAAMGMAAAAAEVEFAFVQSKLGLTHSDLSKHLAVLVERGYLTKRKTGKGAARRTWFAATDAGCAALRKQVQVLESLAGGAVEA